MRKWFRHSKTELIIYAGLWILLFAAPVVSEFAKQHIDQFELPFSWHEVIRTWIIISNFFIAFVIHDLFIAPIYINLKKPKTYVAIAIVFIVAMVSLSLSFREEPPPPPPQHVQQAMQAHAHTNNTPTPVTNGQHPPRPIDRHDIFYFVVLLLGMGLNVGVKGYFRWRDEQERLEELERQSLNQQLEYLKYQVNPHFLMNTLNNIHALIDIDSEKAKKSIVVLSKMLRHLLYDGARESITLQQEADFIRCYVDLMKLRFDDGIDITLDIPDSLPRCEIAPLLFVVFIENAFKHGVSYNKHSFVHIALNYDADAERVNFTCRNSILPDNEDRHDGLGLDNARRRLDLLYDNDYQISTREENDTYEVALSVPTALHSDQPG